MAKFDFTKILGTEDTFEEWLTGFISWKNPDDSTARMERTEYYRHYFPKDFDVKKVFDQLQKIKQELREKDILYNYCDNHIGAEKYYNSKYGLNCPRCNETNINTKKWVIP